MGWFSKGSSPSSSSSSADSTWDDNRPATKGKVNRKGELDKRAPRSDADILADLDKGSTTTTPETSQTP